MFSSTYPQSVVPHDSAPPPAPFLQITPSDKADAIRTSELVQAILASGKQVERASVVKDLLERQGDTTSFVNARDTRGRTPLMHAIANCAIDVLPTLIECRNVDLLARDRFGNTALMYAVGHGYENTIRLLLNGLNKRCKYDDRIMLNYLHMENYDGETALELALKAGHEECALALSEFLKAAMKKEERRKSSIAYRLGFGKRSPPLDPRKNSRVGKNGVKPQTSAARLRRKSLDDEAPFSTLRRLKKKRSSLD